MHRKWASKFLNLHSGSAFLPFTQFCPSARGSLWLAGDNSASLSDYNGLGARGDGGDGEALRALNVRGGVRSRPAFEDTWIECLGDLGRYRMAIEDDDTGYGLDSRRPPLVPHRRINDGARLAPPSDSGSTGCAPQVHVVARLPWTPSLSVLLRGFFRHKNPRTYSGDMPHVLDTPSLVCEHGSSVA
ncbi:hypothetical protein CONLIGDRAFT_419033 [Coniochaeta ligniaria NRRL 30616]|uniref:Uncharacterized protein n=1 Tax=Coniochaeta ligniaria NRRL 30616 TaxID=1408157 RepID=A0A1J7IHM1_9PEZI|nr:hypothetical protein CONLIGDRAFT_419033 [Coniochaeta ligniaria NRRL 30616]